MSENQLDRWDERLKKLPIFNMSLSSKELFHSNFIAWIIETYPVQMGKFFSEILNIDEDQTINKGTVQREKKNVDLVFELGDTLVLIENKVKSIAYKEQLDKYSQYMIKEFNPHKLNKIEYILLSLKEPTFFNEDGYYETKNKNNQLIKWIYVSYERLIGCLNELSNEQDNTEKSKYHKALIDDYVEFINILEEDIVQKIESTSIVSLYKKDTNEHKMLKKLTNLRMHDFFQKGVFENLAQDVYEKLNKENINNGRIHLGKEEKNTAHKYIVIEHGMTRAVGQLHLFYRVNDNVEIGIQIQGNQYRKFLEGKGEKNIFSEATRLKDTLFCFPEILNDKDIVPSKVNGKLKELAEKIGIDTVDLDFNKYHTKNTNHLFLYKYVTLDKMLKEKDESNEPNEKLITLICNDIENMIQKIEE